MNLYGSILEHSNDAPAILFEHRAISYEELRFQILLMARVVAFFKVKKGDRVVLLLNDSPEFIASFIAICSLGAIAVPVNVSLGSQDHRAILSNCEPCLIFIEDYLYSQSQQLFEDLTVPIITVKRDENSETARPQSSRPLSSIVAEVADSVQPEFVEPADSEPAFILYTSGSTGQPKGAIHRQSDIFYTNQTYCREVLQITKGDRLFSSSRLPFAYGLGNALTFPLLNGATSILCRQKPTPTVIAEILAGYRPTVFFAVPVVYYLLLEHHRGAPVDCSSLRLCISAGEALPAQLGERWKQTFGVEVLDGIGSTEMLHMFMSNHASQVQYGSSGKLLAGYEARLLDAENNPVADGIEGNLWVRGDSAAQGYWKRPEETARTFVDGWVRTGDLYRCDAEGNWFHMGRSDDCFKSSGQWVSPVEIEGLLLRLAGVARVAVVEDFDEEGLPCPCAFIVGEQLEFDASTLESGLRAFMAQAVPRFKQPRNYVFVTELPYTATGKVQRYKLRELLRKKRQLTA